ncbi:PfkB family carbohydrate kinase [Spiroplasma culicicola]|uniref:Ribokinase n=1 Tax=Spiroplasma culicicola AES-1 TaxID=1276246 RepID=W6A779_9MOLU|nr:PfkB family carbohydrate kinase [Spiroplasma culicicola]AHI52852.1 ribokinase [Spiroplasma culicicola AES-1]
MKKVGVVGSMTVDLTLHVNDFPKEGDKFTFAANARSEFGGVGAITAIALAKLGVNVAMCGKLQDDHNGMAIIANLKKHHVNTNQILRDQNSPTGMSMVLINKNNKANTINAPGSNLAFDSNDIEDVQNFIYLNDAIVFQLDINNPFIFEMINYAKEEGKFVVLNAVPGSFVPTEILKDIDLLIANTHQLETILGVKTAIKTEEQIKMSAEKLVDIGVGQVVVTLAEKGCAYFDGKKFSVIKPFEVKKVKRAGANEAFTAMTVKSIIDEAPILEGLATANKAAAYALTIDGYADSLPTVEDLKGFKG